MNTKLLLRTLATTSLLVATPAFADDIPSTATIDVPGTLPVTLSIKEVTGSKDGEVERIVTWNEGDGPHIAVFASVTKQGQKGGDTWWSKGLYVATFKVEGSKFKKVQDIKELVQPCNLDMTASFVDGSISLTNLDGDDKGELTFAYVTRCAGDVSPLSMKVLVLEGKDKHALRGQTRIDVGNGEVVGGDFKADFKKAPALLEHAKKVWARFVDTKPY